MKIIKTKEEAMRFVISFVEEYCEYVRTFTPGSRVWQESRRVKAEHNMTLDKFEEIFSSAGFSRYQGGNHWGVNVHAQTDGEDWTTPMAYFMSWCDVDDTLIVYYPGNRGFSWYSSDIMACFEQMYEFDYMHRYAETKIIKIQGKVNVSKQVYGRNVKEVLV